MNSKSSTLIKNTIIVAIGKICTQFVSFILLPFYTTYLTTKEFGIVDLLNTYISLLIPLIFLQVDQAVFRFLIDARNKNEEEIELISTSVIFAIIESFMYLIIYIFISRFINNDYKIFLGINVVAAMFSNLILQISRGMGDNKSYSVGCIVSGIGTIILNVILIYFYQMGAYGVLWASLIANILCTIIIILKKRLYKFITLKKFNRNILKKLLKYSVPLVPNMLSWWIINVSDRTIISAMIDVAANGVYSAANKFSTICVSLFNIFSMTWSESASLYINDDDRDNFFNGIINDAITLFSSICICAIAVLPFVFKIFITGESYQAAYDQIAILLIATIFNIIVSLFGSIYVALKKTKEIAKTSIYAAVINIVINLLLIKKIGLFAASLSTLISYAAMSCYRYWDIKKYLNIKLDFKRILIIISILIINTISYYANIRSISCIVLLFTCTVSIFLNKNILISLSKKYIKK